MSVLRIHRFEVVESTNDVTLGMARRGEPPGTAVVARSQLRGRGRRGRSWWDAPGESLLMSVITRPDIPLSRFCQLSFAASLAAADLLAHHCGIAHVQLKWPNDVLAGGRKIGGVMVEVAGTEAVIGIGINVLQRSFPGDLAQTATSVALEGGACEDVDALIEPLAGSLLANVETLGSHGFEDILARWRKYMWGLGERAEVLADGDKVTGVISGVDCDGALIVTDEADAVHRIYAADSWN